MTDQKNWAGDYDLFDTDYTTNPFPIWDELRATCPVAHSDRHGGSWMTTTYADVTAVARDPKRFSSRDVSVIPAPDDTEATMLPAGLPPIQADPPVHTWTRRVLLPWFSHDRVATYEPYTRQLCRELLDGFADAGHVDAAEAYAKQIPVRVTAKILGIPEDMSDTFIEWVRAVLEFADDGPRRSQAQVESVTYFLTQMETRRHGDGTDLISEMLRTEHDGEVIPDDFIVGTVALILIAGLHGCPVKEGDRVLLNFAAANRDPDAFPDPDRVIIDRELNRHVAFGAGIHRCAGSNLARMELRVAIDEWLDRIPSFRLDRDVEVTWAAGQVRGPRRLPIVFA